MSTVYILLAYVVYKRTRSLLRSYILINTLSHDALSFVQDILRTFYLFLHRMDLLPFCRYLLYYFHISHHLY